MNEYQVMVWSGSVYLSPAGGWDQISVSAKRCIVTEEGDLCFYYGGEIAAIFARDMWRDVVRVGGQGEKHCCD